VAAEDTLVQLAIRVIAAAFLVGTGALGLIVLALLSAAIGAGSRELEHAVPSGVTRRSAWLEHRLRLRYGIARADRAGARRWPRFESTDADAARMSVAAPSPPRPAVATPRGAPAPLVARTRRREQAAAPRRSRRAGAAGRRPKRRVARTGAAAG